MAQEQRTPTTTLPEIVYLVVEDDYYELPIYVCDDVRDVMWFFNISRETALDMMENGTTRFGLRIEKVNL